jgi:hypothetical protein
MYLFAEQLAKGEQSECELDTLFAKWYDIIPATMDQQRQGIDRIFTRKDNGQVHKIEYKTDWTAGRTHNAFVETVSVSTTNKPGWVHSSQADYLIYFVPDDCLIYIIAFAKLRARLPFWKKFKTASAENDGYSSTGILVPLGEFERIAKQVIST